MSDINKGNQLITWKYQTELKADQLNTALAGLATTGLCTRPTFILGGNQVQITPFSAFVHPSDMDVNSKYYTRIVKVSIETNVILDISVESMAIGLHFSFTDLNGSQVPTWYADFDVLTKSDIQSYNGIIIATIQYDANNSQYYISSDGADISDSLLVYEGWNPNCWVSAISPRRTKANTSSEWYKDPEIEIRTHNDLFSLRVGDAAGISTKNQQEFTFDLNMNAMFGIGISSKGITMLSLDSSITSIVRSSSFIGIANGRAFKQTLPDPSKYAGRFEFYPIIHGSLGIPDLVYNSGTKTLTIG